MHLSTTLVLLATALTGASALPSTAGGHRHAHVHARLHERGVQARSGKWIKHVQPAAPAAAYEEEATPTPTPTPTPAAAPSETPASSSGGKKAFCNGESYRKRATSYDISYTGNTGTPGNWGCNIMQVDCSTVDLYDYAAKFKGAGSSSTSYACSAFNKIGPEGKIDGFWFSALDFNVKGGETVCLAFDTDSQGGVACGAGSVPKTSNGQLSGTWAEFDFGSGKNGGQSGADVSTIVADADDGSRGIIAMTIDAPGKGTCSKLSLTNPSSSFEVYRGGMEDEDGVGCKGYSKGCINITVGE
ncbi:uncharacterized protein DNG_07818 [Cephalotrichum gorgonifer]|uniref:Allergen Asp f 4 n=1 Tax=Cephalotrichum gorgonifer TaxID=2041049 RepID=A0AAE8SYL2_9PEZI|nr:uncharacterized protein DNG_07818 [Cephalotrichum gorgonifer]